MSEQVYVGCVIVEENSVERLVKSKLFDGQDFEIRTPYWSVVPVTDSPTKAAWLLVEVLGKDEKNDKIFVKLPAPSLSLGHNVVVAKNNTASPSEES